MSVRILVVEHQESCPPLLVGRWLEEAGCTLSVCRPYAGDALPAPTAYDGVLVLGGLTGLLSREIKTQQRSIVRETNRNSGFITESLSNIELIKGLGLTFTEIRRLKAQTDSIFALEMEKVKRIRLLAFLQGSTLSLLRLAILFALLWLIFRDVLSTGELIAAEHEAASLERDVAHARDPALATVGRWSDVELDALGVERRPV